MEIPTSVVLYSTAVGFYKQFKDELNKKEEEFKAEIEKKNDLVLDYWNQLVAEKKKVKVLEKKLAELEAQNEELVRVLDWKDIRQRSCESMLLDEQAELDACSALLNL
jgi:chromosome segregation ATPase